MPVHFKLSLLPVVILDKEEISSINHIRSQNENFYRRNLSSEGRLWGDLIAHN